MTFSVREPLAVQLLRGVAPRDLALIGACKLRHAELAKIAQNCCDGNPRAAKNPGPPLACPPYSQQLSSATSQSPSAVPPCSGSTFPYRFNQTPPVSPHPVFAPEGPRLCRNSVAMEHFLALQSRPSRPGQPHRICADHPLGSKRCELHPGPASSRRRSHGHPARRLTAMPSQFFASPFACSAPLRETSRLTSLTPRFAGHEFQK